MPLGSKYTDLDECLLTYIEWYRANEARVVTFESAVQFLDLACKGRVYLLHLLYGEIVALRNSFTNVTDLDAALDRYTTKYATTVETITDPVKMVAFLKETTDDCLHLLHMLRTELRNAEHTEAQDTLLYLPTPYRP